MSNTILPRSIVAAIDGSPDSIRAANYALELAKLTNAEVFGLHVILLPQYVNEDVQEKLKEELAHRGREALSAVETVARRANVRFEGAVLDTTGSVVDAICEFASYKGAGMIVVGQKGAGGVSELMLGSVAAGITRKAKSTVVVVK